MKKILLCLLLICCCSILPAQSLASKIGAFPVGVWEEGAVITAILNDIRHVNANFIHDKISPSEVLMSDGGLKILFEDTDIVFNNEDSNLGITHLGYLGHHSSILGYLYTDEPDIKEFHNMQPYAQNIAAYDSTFAHSANLLPMYDKDGRVTGNSSIPVNYNNYGAYIDSFVTIFNPTFLMFDHYPILNNINKPCLKCGNFYANLDIMAQKSEEYNLPFIYVAAVIGSIDSMYSKNIHAKITQDQMHSKTDKDFNYVLNSALAYGAKGIMYWCSVHWSRLSSDAKKYLAQYNKKLIDHSDILLSLHFKAAYHKSFVSTIKSDYEEDILPYSSWNNFISDTNAVQIFNTNNTLMADNGYSADSLVVSFLTDNVGRKYFWILNKSLRSEENFIVNLASGCRIFDVFANDNCGFCNQVHLTLLPGEAKLFKTNVYNGGTHYVQLDTNTWWNAKKHVSANVIVPNGITLTISDTVTFSENAKIIVQQGGILNILNGVLTSSCENVLWQGIEVWGTPSAGQYTVNPNATSPQQGEVILNNAVIANAVCGVRAGRENRLNTGGGGGVIKATNTLFLNNKEAVHFNAYSHVNAYNKVTDNVSTFHHCTFSVNDNAYYTMDTGCVQVTLHNVRGVRFNGCNFEDMQSKNDWTQQGTALYACNAGFRMNENTGIMTYPATCHDTACTFYNFKNGIAVTGSAEKPVHVYHAVFTNNSIGINAKNADALSVISCSFSSGSTSYSTDVHGLVADSCTMYRVENNTFTGIGNGIKIIGKTADNNTIRLNTFQNLCRGIEIYGLNGNGYDNENNNYTALTGLQLKCNIFVEDSTDIYVDAPASVKRYQGYENEACGNYFEGESALHINNQSNKRIFYYYKSSVNAQNPYPSNQLFEAATANDVCGDRYGCIGSSYYNMPVSITECENVYNSTYNMYISALDNYLTLYEGIEIDWDNVTGINGEENSQLGDLIQLSELKNTLDESCITAINILNNAAEPMVSDIALWLERLSSLHAGLLAARYYTLNTDVAQLQHIWSQIITSGSDIGTENSYDYQLCLNYLNTWSQDTSSTVTVSEGAIDSIRNIAMAHNTASLLAESVLEHINELYPHWKQHIHTSCIWVQPIASRPYRSSDIRNENAVIISPNPTNDIINIFTQNIIKITKITLYDIYGKQLINIKLNNDNYQVDLSPYAAGIYVLRCTLDNRQETVKKVVKQ